MNNNVDDGTPEAKRKNYSDRGDDGMVESPVSNEPVKRRSEKVVNRMKKEEKIDN